MSSNNSGKGDCRLELGENIVAFLNNEELQPGSEVKVGDTLSHRCSDIGKFKFSGSVRRTCVGGDFDGDIPECVGLNQHFDYSQNKPPTILFRYEGSIAQTNEGGLMVFPGTTLHMECLFQKMFGTPNWVAPKTTTRSHLQGWAQEPMRDATLEYRLSIYHAKQSDSGLYTCNTPNNQSHSVEIIVADTRCPTISLTPGLVSSSNQTEIGASRDFWCDNWQSLVGSPSLECLHTGQWSALTPSCEDVVCPDINNLVKAGLALQYWRGDTVSPCLMFITSTGIRFNSAKTCRDYVNFKTPV